MKSALKMTTKLSAVALAALWVLLATPAHAATSITACGNTITVPGDYRLDADLACTGDGITIVASKVHLQLNSHQISGPGNNNIRGIVVQGPLTGVEIKGPGVVTGFEVGIFIDNADDTKVYGGVVISLNLVGIAAQAVTKLQLKDNLLSTNFLFGAFLLNSTNGQVQNNVMNGLPFLGGGGAGIALSGSGNEVNGNTTLGYFVGILVGFQGAASGNRIHDNITSGNFQAGVLIADGSVGNRIEHNQALGNTSGFFSSGGIDLVDVNATCGTNRWHDNTFITASQACIQ